MSALESLVQSYFLALELNKDEFTGYIDGREEFLRFTDDLRAIGFMFIIRTTSAGSSFLFNHTRRGAKTQVPFFGPLFQITKNLSYECRFGKNRNHAPKHSQNVVTEIKKERSCLPSKKIGCKAMMHVSQLTIYPEFTISDYNSHGSVKQTEVRRQLNEAIAASRTSPPSQASRPPITVTRYSVAISHESVHSHSLAIAQACQSLHPKLAAEIKRLSWDGNATVPQVRLHLESFVQRMIKETSCVTPNRQNRCYYPTNKVIYQHLHSALVARKKNRSDRITLEKYIESRDFRNADLDDAELNDGKKPWEATETDVDSLIEDKYKPLDIPQNSDKPAENSSVKTNLMQLVKVKIMSPNLSSTKSPCKSIVPKLKVLSDEADVSMLRTEIWKLLEQSHDRVHVVEDVASLETARMHLLAAGSALASAPANKTVSVFLRSTGRGEAQKVTPVIIRNRVAFEMDPAAVLS